MLATVSQANRLCVEARGYYERALQEEEIARQENKRARDMVGGRLKSAKIKKRSKFTKQRAEQFARIASETLQQAFELIPATVSLRQRNMLGGKNLKACAQICEEQTQLLAALESTIRADMVRPSGATATAGAKNPYIYPFAATTR